MTPRLAHEDARIGRPVARPSAAVDAVRLPHRSGGLRGVRETTLWSSAPAFPDITRYRGRSAP